MKQKCEWVAMLLQPLKHALNGSKLEFRGLITDDIVDNSSSILYMHIEEELLPICNACCSYYFNIEFCSFYEPQKGVIEKFLQFYQITACSNVVLTLRPVHEKWKIELPVDAIANWLHRNRNRNYDSINPKVQKEKEQILEIRIDGCISNVSAMLSCLKKVN